MILQHMSVKTYDCGIMLLAYNTPKSSRKQNISAQFLNDTRQPLLRYWSVVSGSPPLLFVSASSQAALQSFCILCSCSRVARSALKALIFCCTGPMLSYILRFRFCDCSLSQAADVSACETVLSRESSCVRPVLSVINVAPLGGRNFVGNIGASDEG